jgi:hypothetical protein
MEAIVPSGVTRRKRGSDHSWVPSGSSAIRKLSPNPRRSEKLTRCSEPIRCGTVCSKIVYSVRIGPLQPNSLQFQRVPEPPQPSELTNRGENTVHVAQARALSNRASSHRYESAAAAGEVRTNIAAMDLFRCGREPVHARLQSGTRTRSPHGFAAR